MFDPAASLMKTMGLAMPADAAGSVIPAMPGEGGEAAGNGGFASLLATKIDAAAPDLTIGAAMQPAPQPAAETSASALLSPADADLPAKALPATGKMLPLDLPVAFPVAQAISAVPPTAPEISANAPAREEATVAKPALQAAAPAIAITAAVRGQAKHTPEVTAPDPAPAPTPSTDPTAAAAPVQKAAPVLLPMAARAAALMPQPAEEAGPAPEPEAAPAARSVPAQLFMPAAEAKPRSTRRGAEAQAAEIPEPAEDQPQPAFKAQGEEPARSPIVVEAAPVILAAALAVPASPAPLEAKPAEPLPAAPQPRGAAPLLAVATIAREVSPEAPRTEMPQQVAQPQPQVPQATIRIAAAPADARREGEPVTVAARAGEAEPASETAPATAALRTAQPFAMLSPAMPAQAPLTLSAMPASAVQAPTDFAQIVDRLVAAREAVAPSEVRVTIDHAQFGKVSVGFTPDSSGMSVTLAAADPEFARAVEAAAPFAPPSVTTETQPIPAPAAARGADLTSAFTGQQGQQAGRQAPQDTRPSGPQANPSARTTDSDEKPGKGRGIFA